MHDNDPAGIIFRIDTFIVPAAAKEEFLQAVTETNTAFESLPGCLQKHVLLRSLPGGDSTYLTFVEWESAAAYEEAKEIAAAKHQELNLHPQEMYRRLGIRAELGVYIPTQRVSR